MIKLDLEDYCEDCPYFESIEKGEKGAIYFGEQPAGWIGDVTVTCVHGQACGRATQVEREKATKVMYLCDGKACDECDGLGFWDHDHECNRTQDVNHAKNFVKRNGFFEEMERNDACVIKEKDEREEERHAGIRHHKSGY